MLKFIRWFLLVLIAIGAVYFAMSKKPADLDETMNWKTFTDAAQGVSFKYPASFSTKYIQLVDWPPAVQVIEGEFVCTEAGREEERAGKTELRKINGWDYCVTVLTEGAAGSIYMQYAYATKIEDKNIFFTFTTRTPQCANYDEPSKTECETERANLNIDNVIDQIAQTITLSKKNLDKNLGNISGTVMLGPTCPVMRDPPDPDCADKPYATSLALTTPDGAKVIKTFSSNTEGKFNIEVQPGTYAIRSAAVANILPYCNADVFTVKTNISTNVNVSCDTGIR